MGLGKIRCGSRASLARLMLQKLGDGWAGRATWGGGKATWGEGWASDDTEGPLGLKGGPLGGGKVGHLAGGWPTGGLWVLVLWGFWGPSGLMAFWSSPFPKGAHPSPHPKWPTLRPQAAHLPTPSNAPALHPKWPTLHPTPSGVDVSNAPKPIVTSACYLVKRATSFCS